MKINEYIESGILESYVMGSASEVEANELLQLKEQYPQIQEALYNVEIGFEQISVNMAIPPSTATWLKIETEINEITKRHDVEALSIQEGNRDGKSKNHRKGNLIDIESTSSYMRVHKVWRWIIVGLFILGKIFLGCAIFFYFANRHSEERIEELKTELRQERGQK